MTVSEAARRDLHRLVPACPRTESGSSTEGPDAVFRPRPTGPGVRRGPRAGTAIAPGRAVPALRGRPEPAQEPAPADRGVRARRGRGASVALDPGRRPRRRLPHPRPRAARGGRAARAGRVGSTSRASSPTTSWSYLYNRAYALVQPSLMEGFGLPPVEAMACGTPVLYEPRRVAARGRRRRRPRSSTRPTSAAIAAALRRPAGRRRPGATDLAARALRRGAAVHLGRRGPRPARPVSTSSTRPGRWRKPA